MARLPQDPAVPTSKRYNKLKSLCEAHDSEDAWVRGIDAQDTYIGFLIMSIWARKNGTALYMGLYDFSSLSRNGVWVTGDTTGHRACEDESPTGEAGETRALGS
ncbi:uncharacterized protein G6M90_00g003220 [Metarhizium brunneum]|uniref:Uncharacterized protein n=1 Tax=Metarhizium brunneum TaxID=500148 RepID=A0A7D5UQ47_9HYPO